MTQPIGNAIAPYTSEDNLQQGGDKVNIHFVCTTQDDNTQYLKTCAVRRVLIDVVDLSTDNPPERRRIGEYTALGFSTCKADSVRWVLPVPPEMNVERESSLFAVLAAATASTESIRSVFDYVNTCHAGGDLTAAALTTSNTVCTTGSNALSTAASKLAEIKVATFSSGSFYQVAQIGMEWARKSSTTVDGDAHPGLINVVAFQFQYFDRRASTAT